MSTRGTAAALALALAALGAWPRAATGQVGPLATSPAPRVLSVRVGERIDFSAAAPGARAFTWSVWGRPVSHEAAWSYVPAPPDAGWQQVTVAVDGSGASRAEHTWDVGVVPALEPALLAAVPPPGRVALDAGAQASFRCDARVPAARPADRLRFEWAVDDRPVYRAEEAAASASSTFAFAAQESGEHRLSVRIWEEEQAAVHLEWTVDVAAGPVNPGELHGPFAPRLVRMPGARRLAALPGEEFRFVSGVTPALPRTRFAWAVDGEPMQRGSEPRFDYTADGPGEHRVSVSVVAADTWIGGTSWTIDVEELPAAAVPTAAAAPVLDPTAAAPTP